MSVNQIIRLDELGEARVSSLLRFRASNGYMVAVVTLPWQGELCVEKAYNGGTAWRELGKPRTWYAFRCYPFTKFRLGSAPDTIMAYLPEEDLPRGWEGRHYLVDPWGKSRVLQPQDSQPVDPVPIRVPDIPTHLSNIRRRI